MAEVTLNLDRVKAKDLPACCMCCGAPSTVNKDRNFRWCPPWVSILILAGLLPYFIVSVIMTEYAEVSVPLCATHSGHWSKRNLIIWLGFGLIGVLFIIAIMIAITMEERLPAAARHGNWGGLACVGLFLATVVWLIFAFVIQAGTIRPTLIDEDDIELTNVAPEFVEAMQEHRRELKRQRMAYQTAAGAAMPDNIMACPYCGEPIKATAMRCKYCKEDLDEEEDEYD